MNYYTSKHKYNNLWYIWLYTSIYTSINKYIQV